MSQPERLYNDLALVRGIVEGAFFSPLRTLDWVAFCYNQPGLLGLEREEVYDLFVRGAIAAETIYPSLAQGRTPLGWLWAVEDPVPVLAHVMASLRADRPFLFHRVIFNQGPVRDGSLDPDEFDLVEDYLAKALSEGADIRRAAYQEIKTVTRRGLMAAGQDPAKPDAKVAQAARAIMSRAQPVKVASDAELLTWLTLGGGLQGVPEELAPAVVVMVWAAWCGAVVGAPPNLEVLLRLQPELEMSGPELAMSAPPPPQAGHFISATCPFCTTENQLKLGKQVQEVARCPHLIYVGTSDEAHLLNVLGYFQLGPDFKALLDSYYSSPADLELFGTIVDDLYEMISGQGRLSTTEVTSPGTKGFYYLRAFFAAPQEDAGTQH